MLFDPKIPSQWTEREPPQENEIPVYDPRYPGEYHGKHFSRPIYRWRHPDPVTDRMIADLCIWLEGKPKDKRYCYADQHICMFTQFGKECGYPWVAHVIDLKEFVYVANGTPKTYGAALERLKSMNWRAALWFGN